MRSISELTRSGRCIPGAASSLKRFEKPLLDVWTLLNGVSHGKVRASARPEMTECSMFPPPARYCVA